MAGTGDQEANLKKVLSGFSNPVVVTQADAYPAKIQNHIVTEVGVIPDLEKCILNRTELPLAKVEDKTSSMHLYQPYQVGKGQCGSLSLTYQDGSKKTYFVTIDVQEVKPTGVVTSKGDPLVQKAKPAGIITSKVDPLVQEAKPAGVVTSKDDPLVQKAKPAGVVISKGEPLLQKANPAGVVISKGEPLVQETNPAGVVTSKVDPLVQKAKPAGVVTSKVDPLVQKAKPAAVITSKVDPLVQKATPAGVVTSKGDPLVELTKADHATELSHLTELLEKKVPSIKQKQLSQQISSDVHINAKKLPQLGADCRILVYLVSFMSIFIIGSSKYVINKDKK